VDELADSLEYLARAVDETSNEGGLSAD